MFKFLFKEETYAEIERRKIIEYKNGKYEFKKLENPIKLMAKKGFILYQTLELYPLNDDIILSFDNEEIVEASEMCTKTYKEGRDYSSIDFYRVKTKNSKIGYILKEGVKEIVPHKKYGKLLRDTKLKKYPCADAYTIADINPNEIFTIFYKTKDYYSIVYKGMKGYINISDENIIEIDNLTNEELNILVRESIVR